MKKQKKLVVGNWKMNPQSLDEAKEIVREVKKITAKLKKTEVVLCPPFVYVGSVSSSPKNNIYFGAQDAHPEASGSFTGEVSSSQLYQFGVRFVIVGHSERRKMGESDELVNKKVKSVLGEGMTAILCVGEDKRDHHGEYFNFIKSQILLGLKDVQKKVLLRVVIAYEPIWAIGAKEAVKPSELHEMSIF
ncbi:MAG: triosephosphate isomerase, partial [Candidatus Zambryskibacteria bacterium]|nr:triosephosphate isomerase [Candidatus Zambryskibacteria bacterium]